MFTNEIGRQLSINSGSFLGLGINVIKPWVSEGGKEPFSTLSNITSSRKGAKSCVKA